MSNEPAKKPVVIQPEPYNAETPMGVLAEPVTPVESFFVRTRFPIPRIEAERWRLRVDGAVAKPMELTLADLVSRGRAVPVLTTLECAGNGRASMRPTVSGTPWAFGASGTATFMGIPLSSLLDAAGVKPGVVEILAEGADRAEVQPGQSESYVRSLPIEVARRPDVLVAWEMNGQALTAEHGFPVRLVVPGWYGMASVKWLVKLTAITTAFAGHFQRDDYCYEGEAGISDGTPVTEMRVRSVIASPVDGAKVRAGEAIEIVGSAWSGAGSIANVSVSVDGGKTWKEAAVDRIGVWRGSAPRAVASTWRLAWTPDAPGRYGIVARAEDEAGNVQPMEPLWNKRGYGNNAVQRVMVEVE